jgi:aspartokinase
VYLSAKSKLKEEFLRLLKEDEEFRLAVAGFLGLDTVLSELKKLREDFLLFMREQEKRWEEAYRRFEALEKKLLEHDVRLNRLEKRASRVELELGALTEITLTRYAWEDLREEIKSRGEEITARRRNIIIDKHEVDLLVETNKSVYVVEVKVKPRTRDIRELLAKVKAVEEKYKKPVIPVLAGTLLGNDVLALAESKGIRVLSY